MSKKKKEWIEILRVLLAWGDSSMKKKNLEGTWALAPFREKTYVGHVHPWRQA